MSATLTQARAAVASQLSAAITGWQIVAYMLALPTPPAIDVRPGPEQFDQAMAGGLDEQTLLIRAMISYAADLGAQSKLDSVLGRGAGTIKSAIEADPTLGGVVEDCWIQSQSDYKALIPEQGTPLLAVEFTAVTYL